MDEGKMLAAIGELRGEMHAATGELRTMIGELHTVMMTRFERIEDRLTRMAADIAVTMMAVDAESKRRRSDRSELLDMAEMMTAMQRQTMRLRTDVDQLNSTRPAAG